MFQYCKEVLVFFLLVMPICLNAQNCNLSIKGLVLDEHTQGPLEFATIYLEELERGAIADSNGVFKISGLCKGEYHIKLSHIGCNGIRLFVNLKSDTFLNLTLHHHSEFTNEVGVHGKRETRSSSVSSTITKEDVAAKGDKSLAEIVEDIQGVSVLKTGTGVSKPVIHGMYGNRVSVVNNGVKQGGQQWGNDHAPEIDPFVANHIAVVKGASALEYSSNALGGVVLIESSEIEKEPHLHGSLHSILQSNGRGLTFNAQAEKYGKWAAWRVISTYKRNGDLQTPDYFLTNTGKEEKNVAIQVEKEVNNWENTVYYSYFNAKMGILRGAHIGNLTDLQAALLREEPFFTKEEFSYGISAPRQEVQHHLLKLESHKKLKNKNKIRLTYALQMNDRKEFDVRRSGRTDLPALSMQKLTNIGKATYEIGLANKLKLKLGAIGELQNNENNPETGILPLIPNYSSFQPGGFLIFKRTKKKFHSEVGVRYDYKVFDVKAISKSVPRTIEHESPSFHNVNLMAGANYDIKKKMKVNISLGYVERAPDINELYSNGLHQGVSGIEEGDKNIQSEKSYKALLSYEVGIKNRFFFQALGYYQFVKDFIYLQPQDSFRLTIRGAYPLYLYKQTDAVIYGSDFLLTYEPQDNIRFVLKYSNLKGEHIKDNLVLINLPSNNLSLALKYSVKDKKGWKDNNVKLGFRHVFKQDKVLGEQDYVAPPPAYSLIDFNAGTTLKFKKTNLKVGFEIENLTNQRYKDYLDRQRYYAHAAGRNVKVKLGFLF